MAHVKQWNVPDSPLIRAAQARQFGMQPGVGKADAAMLPPPLQIGMAEAAAQAGSVAAAGG
ncbi:MAG: hypothetical protein ACSLEN_07430 [Candidatus Malihini olakiniferum]